MLPFSNMGKEFNAYMQKLCVSTAMAVSYTHLDVYKRQQLWKAERGIYDTIKIRGAGSKH